MRRIPRHALLLLASLALLPALRAELRLPALFSDHMVLQRGQPIAVWGWANPGAAVDVTLGPDERTAIADASGRWRLELPARSQGSGLRLEVASAEQSRAFQNLAMGDVWICSGQSNMEWPLNNTEQGDRAVANATHPDIRLFTVQRQTSFVPLEDVSSSGWHPATPASAASFSAVAYYFGRMVNRETGVPIGLIHTSWGGTNIQTWISWEVMSQKPQYAHLDVTALQARKAESERNRQRFLQAMEADRGMQQGWFQPDASLDGWSPIPVPAEWGSTPVGDADGIVWYRLEFELPAALAPNGGTLHLGPIDDRDHTYLNGTFLGSTSQYDAHRSYDVPIGLLKPGSNSLVIKVTDFQGGGGIMGQPQDLYLDVAGKRVPLAGPWLHRPAVLSTDFGAVDGGPNAYPSQLFNAMVHPLLPYPVAGAIWYQGESNTGQAYRYRSLFPTLIQDWRQQWGQPFPFYWAQLANFMAPRPQPGDSAWAELREAQDRALELPRTGQAILIDIGEADDIHPRNKKDVGERLARVALHDAYGKQIVYSGPRYRSMKRKRDAIELAFDHVHGGLVAQDSKYGYLKGFAIAGADQRFHWAQARIQGDTVVVSSPEVPRPVAVRYAWADNPDDANLYNQAGLPAAPFRTDDWKGVTAEN